MLNETSIQEFRQSLRGCLLEPHDKRYDDARKIFNGMIDKHPRFIAQCTDVADVIRSVNFARENQILISVRGGGHGVAGLAICDDGLVIDLTKINYTRVDPVAKTVVAGGGCTLADVDHATHIFGMATPSGIFSSTGVGGLTTGGGFGHFTRKYGLSIDNLLSVDMVLADGRFVTANSEHNQDLFWAIRGGGSNFGIVTAFTFRLHPINIVYAGPVFYDISESTEVMKWYRRIVPDMTDDLNAFFMFLTVPPVPPFPEHLHLKKVCCVFWSYAGPLESAEEVFKPIREFKAPILDFVGPIPQPALQSMFDPLVQPGFLQYWRGDFLKELSDEAIAVHVKYGNTMPTPLSAMHLYPINGAASKVSDTDTPWQYRDAIWNMVIIGCDPSPSNKEIITTWTKQYWEALHPYSAGGAYVNFLGDEGEDRVKATYGKNYDRLASTKSKYDPANLFRMNQNIKPSNS
jgi:FAD/FMN-containing dehydrogenase